jgi:hypothetical protein
LAEIDTVILGLGKPYYRVLTQTHSPEDLLGDRFPVPRTFREADVTLVDGKAEHAYRLRIDVTRPIGPGSWGPVTPAVPVLKLKSIDCSPLNHVRNRRYPRTRQRSQPRRSQADE